MELSFQTILLRLVVATVLSGMIGIEREIHQKPAGVRTNALIGLGSAVMALTGVYIWTLAPTMTDPSRMASIVVQGIGFIGAGAIMQASGSVHGLTTAATMWVVAGIGVACGLGFFTAALAVAVITLILLAIFGPLDYRLMGSEAKEGKGFFKRFAREKEEK